MKSIVKAFANINILIGAILMVLPIGMVIFLNLPKETAAAYDSAKEDTLLTQPVITEASTITSGPKYTFKDPFVELTPAVPIKEKPLEFTVGAGVSTTGATVQISTLPLNTTIYESNNIEAALAQGVWRDPKYGTPDNNDLPVILAAHRWGENSFSWDYRNKNLFTEFDQLKGGEIVTITWNGKVYQYQITSIETQDHVTKLADLILYTCVDYYSSQRIIVYATRL